MDDAAEPRRSARRHQGRRAGHGVMGPYGAQLLGDLGAEIVKVETGVGDGSRMMGGGPHPELSGIALNLHRNKRSIGLDLKAPAGREILLRPARRRSDVLITNLRPEPAAPPRPRLRHRCTPGLPRLVYCQAQGFRTSSDEADLPAYDDIIQALTGFPQLNAMGFGAIHFVPSTVADKVAGMFIAQGVLAALVARATTGEGQRVEVPMFDAALAFNLVEHLSRAAVPGEPPGYNRVLRATAARTARRRVGGDVAVHRRPLDGAVRRRSARSSCCEQPWFADHRSRLAHADEVYGLLASIIAARRRPSGSSSASRSASRCRRCRRWRRSSTTRRTIEACCSDAEHPVVGPFRSIAAPLVFSTSGQRPMEPAPLVAQHTAEILAELGYSDSDVADLTTAGVIRGPERALITPRPLPRRARRRRRGGARSPARGTSPGDQRGADRQRQQLQDGGGDRGRVVVPGGSTNVEPMVTNTTPIVDALVSDCIRDSTSPKRTTPIAASSTSTAPSRTMTSPIRPSLAAPLDVAGDDRRADERHEGEHDGGRQEGPVAGVHRPDDQQADRRRRSSRRCRSRDRPATGLAAGAERNSARAASSTT